MPDMYEGKHPHRITARYRLWYIDPDTWIGRMLLQMIKKYSGEIWAIYNRWNT